MNTIKKIIYAITSVAVLVVVSPVKLNAQALTAQELARLRTEKTAVERQINQLMPQINRLQQQASTFHQQNVGIVQQKLDATVANEFHPDSARAIWRETWEPNWRFDGTSRTWPAYPNRRRERAGAMHIDSITSIINNSFPNKVIEKRLGRVNFPDLSPWVRPARQGVPETDFAALGRAINQAIKYNGHATGMESATVQRVKCRTINAQYVAARNQEAQLRGNLSNLRRQYERGGGSLARGR